jgi:hypothetical protein
LTTELVVQDTPRQSVVLSTDQLKFIANTEFVPKGIRGNLPAILACVATGREWGIGDMAALRSINIIEGTPTPSAELCVLLVRRAGHSITGDVTDGKATIHGKRGDNGDEMDVEWTTGMAERAGLLGKSNWKKYPEAMLWARAVTQLCRMLFADVFSGATYSIEELDGDLDETEPDAVSAGGLVGVPSQDGATSGSVTPWQQLTQLAKQAGVEKQVVLDAMHTEFPGRKWNELTADECAFLWTTVEAGVPA